MTVVPPPVIESEMADWVLLGGGNSGIVGDANHTYGFHCSAEDISADDYSRWRDPNGSDGPYVDWSYASAGDFSHKNDPALRAMHANVLGRLMAGEMPMICEFIGKPWADQPVLYWARWNGIDTLQKYTGSGHDTWSHISWYRSMVNQRANLWTPPKPKAKGVDVTIMVARSGEKPNKERFWVGDGMYHREVSLDVANRIVGGLMYYGAPSEGQYKCSILSWGDTSPEFVQSIIGPVPLGSGGDGGDGTSLTFDQAVEAARQGANAAEDS